LQGSGGFIVKSLELGTESSRGKKVEGAAVGRQNLGTGTIFHGFDVDEVAIVVIDYKHVCVAGAGGGHKASCEVRKDFSGGFVGIGIQEVRSKGRWVVGDWIFVVVGTVGCRSK
jgi:hypothetical protein